MSSLRKQGSFKSEIYQLVVPAKAGTHMWTAPVPQEFFWFDRIACIHMSGLLMRSVWTTGQDGFRDASSKHASDLYGPMGPTDCLAPWIDRSYHLLLLQLRLDR
jgi:hypothetical protein